jgi:hypothetical protein
MFAFLANAQISIKLKKKKKKKGLIFNMDALKRWA